MGHTIATIFLPRSNCHAYSGYPRVGICLSTGRCTGASSALHRRFPRAKDARLLFDYSIWGVLQEKVHRSTIANVSELDMRLINERGRFVQSIVDAA